MKFSFTPTRGDLVRLGYVAIRSRGVLFWFSVLFFVLLPWVLAVIGIVTLDTAHPMSWVSILTLAVMPPIMIMLFGLIPVLVTRGAKAMQGAHTYELSSGGIDTSGPGFQGRLDWSALNTCVSSPLGILFMSGRLALVSIPGRVLDEISRSELLSLARDKGLNVRSVR